MITDRMKSLAQKYILDEWLLTESEKKEVTDKFTFWETLYCFGSESEIDVIEKGFGQVGKSYDGVIIKWF